MHALDFSCLLVFMNTGAVCYLDLCDFMLIGGGERDHAHFQPSIECIGRLGNQPVYLKLGMKTG